MYNANVKEKYELLIRPYIKISELAIILGISRSTAYRWIDEKKISVTQYGLRTNDVIKAFELEEYVYRLFELIEKK
ncbi:MAG: helix-turn-helix domain-containing protein [Bacillota bacterium]|nr:helix-turn-helix domain-containing protein [Bacillota bacterium]